MTISTHQKVLLQIPRKISGNPSKRVAIPPYFAMVANALLPPLLFPLSFLRLLLLRPRWLTLDEEPKRRVRGRTSVSESDVE